MVHSSVSPLRRGISSHLTQGTNQQPGAFLFDQFLILMRMRAPYVEGSAHVFNHAVVVRGSEQTRAFDHLPMFANFVFGESKPSPDPMAEVRILSVLPNPEGPDEGREQVTLGNGTAAALDLTGWMLRDCAGNRFALIGVIPTGQQLTITIHTFSMPLKYSGDDVSLVDLQGQLRHLISYSAAQAQSAQVVTFERP